MTIDEAIEKNKDLALDMEMKSKPTYAKAIQIGIEALEREREIREILSKPHSATDILLKVGVLLPGETEGENE